MRTHAPCGTLTSKHMQIFVPRYVPSLLRNKEHTMWPPWPHLHVIPHFSPDSFCAGSAEPHTPAAMLLWNAVKKHMTASVHLTLTQHCRWERDVFNRSLKAAGPIFQKFKPVAGAVLWQLTTRRMHNISEANMATSQLKPMASAAFQK